MIQWFFSYLNGTEDVGKLHHSNFVTFLLPAHLEGKEEGKTKHRTHTKEDSNFVPYIYSPTRYTM